MESVHKGGGGEGGGWQYLILSMFSAKFCYHYYPAKFTVSFDFVSGKSMLDLMQKVAIVCRRKESISKDA